MTEIARIVFNLISRHWVLAKLTHKLTITVTSNMVLSQNVDSLVGEEEVQRKNSTLICIMIGRSTGC